MTFRSFAGSSHKVHAGKMMVRLKKPIAAGTRTDSDTATVTAPEANDLDAEIPSTVFRKTGSSASTTIGEQLRRNCRRHQNPDASRSNDPQAPNAPTANTNTAH